MRSLCFVSRCPAASTYHCDSSSLLLILVQLDNNNDKDHPHKHISNERRVLNLPIRPRPTHATHTTRQCLIDRSSVNKTCVVIVCCLPTCSSRRCNTVPRYRCCSTTFVDTRTTQSNNRCSRNRSRNLRNPSVSYLALCSDEDQCIRPTFALRLR